MYFLWNSTLFYDLSYSNKIFVCQHSVETVIGVVVEGHPKDVRKKYQVKSNNWMKG